MILDESWKDFSYHRQKQKDMEDMFEDFYSSKKEDEADRAENMVNPRAEEKFMKYDAGKNMLSLIDPDFIILLGEILTFGAKKYAPNNWQKCEDTSRYKDALLRHIYAYLSGEKVDPESGLNHLGHAAFGLMCLNYFDKKEQK
jgi:hypothetical protein